MINVSQKDAKSYIDAFYNLYPKVREFFDATILECKRKSYVETLFGRRRYIPAINDQNKMIQQGAQREAMNMPIQGTSADIIKIAMIRIAKMLKEGKYKSTMLLQVHDELVFDAHQEEVNELKPLILENMENALLLPHNVPVIAECGVGENWLAAH